MREGKRIDSVLILHLEYKMDFYFLSLRLIIYVNVS